MGILDRVHKAQYSRKVQQAEESLTDSTGQYSLVLAEPPVITRLKGVMHTLRSYIEQNQDGSGLGKMAFLMTTVTDELCYELEDLPPEMVQLYLAQIGEMIAWIGHGENERLPANIRAMAEGIQPAESRESQAVTGLCQSRP